MGNLSLFLSFTFHFVLASLYSTSQHWNGLQLKDQHLLLGDFLFIFLRFSFLHFFLVSCVLKHGFQLLSLLLSSLVVYCFITLFLLLCFLLRFWVIFVFGGFRFYLFDLRWQTQHIVLLHILISSAQGPCISRVDLSERSFYLHVGSRTAYQSNDGALNDNSIYVRTFSMSFWTSWLPNIYFVGFRSLYIFLFFEVFVPLLLFLSKDLVHKR